MDRGTSLSGEPRDRMGASGQKSSGWGFPTGKSRALHLPHSNHRMISEVYFSSRARSHISSGGYWVGLALQCCITEVKPRRVASGELSGFSVSVIPLKAPLRRICRAQRWAKSPLLVIHVAPAFTAFVSETRKGFFSRSLATDLLQGPGSQHRPESGRTKVGTQYYLRTF